MTLDNQGAENLVNAIVKTAVSDWRNAMHRLKRKPDNFRVNYMILDCERFFLSGYFNTMTDLDGREFLRKLYEMEGIPYPYDGLDDE